jgi:hypothetical protein
MHKNMSGISWFIAVSLVLILTAGIASAATETYKISYAGKLTSAAGTPLTGTYNVTFRLYNVAWGGAALATDRHNITATSGQFTTTLTFPALNYNGQQLYVSLQRSPDPEKSRTAVYPVPYALGLRPGAIVTGSGTSPVLQLVKSDSRGVALNASTNGTSSDAVRGYASGSNSRGLYGESTRSVGVYGKGTTGGYFTTNSAGTSENDHTGVKVVTAFFLNPGMNISTKDGYSPGVNVHTEEYESEGINIQTDGDGSDGMHVITNGWSSTGVFAHTYFDDSAGLVARTDGANSPGVSAYTSGAESDGVDVSTSEIGSDGVNAHTLADHSFGVRASTSGNYSTALWAETTGRGSIGVHGISSQSIGVQGNGTNAAGVQGYSTNKAGVWGVSLNDVGIYGETSRADHMYGVMTRDYMSAARYDTNAGDIAEYMDVAHHVPPGTVMIIGEDGKLKTSTTAYDTKVAGIVSTTPGVALGTKEGGNLGEEIIAVAGRVPCRVDAGYGVIHPGDLLTTSDNPGYAMKATNPRMGTVLGKAMGTLESGTGTIEVLVTLQ